MNVVVVCLSAALAMFTVAVSAQDPEVDDFKPAMMTIGNAMVGMMAP